MPYVPNPADATQPIGSVDAGTADDEFRALKAYIQTLALGAGQFGTPRHCVLNGVADVNGQPNYLQTAAGGGLNLDFKAAATSFVCGFANGWGATGQLDSFAVLTNDVANAIPNIRPLVTSYVSADWVTTGSVTWNSYPIAPQYGIAYDQTKNVLLHFEGADASTSMIDAYGNTWTPAGNAQIDTAQFKIGNSSLLLDGTGDYIETLNLNTLGEDSWTIEGYFRFNVLPTPAQNMTFFQFGQNAGNFGIGVYLVNTAGTLKLNAFASSDSTTNGLINGLLGSSTVWAINTWYHIAITFDAIAGKYFLYKDGVSEAGSFPIVSSTRICKLVRSRIGRDPAGTGVDFNGWVDEFRVSRCCRYPNGVTFTPPTVAFGLEGDWFDINAMQMKTPTTASAVAGVNPTFTVNKRVYVGEVDCNAVASTAIRNYSMQARFTGNWTAPLPAVSTTILVNHNLGLIPKMNRVVLQNLTGENGYSPGDTVEYPQAQQVPSTITYSLQPIGRRNVTTLTTGGQLAFVVSSYSSGIQVAATAANWQYRFEASRGW